MRRTRPKGDSNPGWERITWDEALGTIAIKLNEIKAKWGAEAVAFARAGSGGSPMGEMQGWVFRLAHTFGSPNTITTTHICQFHRDSGSAFTYGRPGARSTVGQAEFEKASCILLWGSNNHATSRAYLRDISQGVKQGAKLIVIDTRRTQIAAMADVWLQVQPATDGALALNMLNVMIEENLYNYEFVRDWTTAPFLVRSDNGNFLKANDLTESGDPSGYVIVDAERETPRAYTPGTMLPVEPVIDIALTVKLANGQETECRTASKLLRELVSQYPPREAEKLTGVPADKIRDAVKMFATHKPVCWYPYNGIEQNINASQTNRAACIFYALTGDYDSPGGNILAPSMPTHSFEGSEFLPPEVRKKRLGFKERPLGPAGIARRIAAYELYKAILTEKPYPIKGLVGFGGNIITSNAPSMMARDAISKLDFHVECELFLSPTAELADIVLPAASFWESWYVRIGFRSLRGRTHIQLRPPVVPPQHESWPDMKVIFELAKRLGLGDKFWEGDIEAAFNHHLALSSITVEQLKGNPGGISLELPIEYKKYIKKDNDGKFSGFNTPSKRIEIYSQTLKDYGYNPLPIWQEPITIRYAKTNQAERYPLILTNAKLLQFCHSQHRALPSLRKAVPYPFLEINPRKAREIGCKNGDWLILETPHASITLQAKLTDGIPYNVVCTQHGWWQACPELNLPGFDPYSPEGANANLLYDIEELDPISGSVHIKGYPCNVRKASRSSSILDFGTKRPNSLLKRKRHH